MWWHLEQPGPQAGRAGAAGARSGRHQRRRSGCCATQRGPSSSARWHGGRKRRRGGRGARNGRRRPCGRQTAGIRARPRRRRQRRSPQAGRGDCIGYRLRLLARLRCPAYLALGPAGRVLKLAARAHRPVNQPRAVELTQLDARREDALTLGANRHRRISVREAVPPRIVTPRGQCRTIVILPRSSPVCWEPQSLF